MPYDVVKRAHPLNGLQQQALGDILRVVDIARDQNMADTARRGQAADAVNGVEPRSLQEPQRLLIDKAENLAYLPVRRMNECQCHQGNCPHADAGDQVMSSENTHWSSRLPKNTVGTSPPKGSPGPL